MDLTTRPVRGAEDMLAARGKEIEGLASISKDERQKATGKPVGKDSHVMSQADNKEKELIMPAFNPAALGKNRDYERGM